MYRIQYIIWLLTEESNSLHYLLHYSVKWFVTQLPVPHTNTNPYRYTYNLSFSFCVWSQNWQHKTKQNKVVLSVLRSKSAQSRLWLLTQALTTVIILLKHVHVGRHTLSFNTIMCSWLSLCKHAVCAGACMKSRSCVRCIIQLYLSWM